MPRSHSFAKYVKSRPVRDNAIVTFRKSCVIRPVKNRDPKVSESRCDRWVCALNFSGDVTRCREVPRGPKCVGKLRFGTALTPFITISRVVRSPAGGAARKRLSGPRKTFNICNSKSFGLTRYPLASQHGYLRRINSPERMQDVPCGHQQQNHCKTFTLQDVDF